MLTIHLDTIEFLILELRQSPCIVGLLVLVNMSLNFLSLSLGFCGCVLYVLL